MAEITASAVAKLREMTNAGLMDCKKALSEANGDIDAAVDILRKKGQASAAKKAGREAKEGVIASHIAPGAKVGVMVEINCETDFVARNESFRAFCDDVAKKLANEPGADLEADRVAAVSKIGENVRIGRHTRIEVSGNGLVAAYIHTGAKVGVLVEVGANNPDTTQKEEFKQLVRDITLQIAAASPGAVTRDEVPADVIAKEDEINRQSDRLKGKPAQAMEKILQGMRDKFFQTYCLVDQGFVKNPEMTVSQHIGSVSKTLGDEIKVRRFVRFQVGEVVQAGA
jgi:elongation factor Ts